MPTSGMWQLSPEALMKRWRDTIQRRFGKDIADASRITYLRGWYYVNTARRFDDGSIGFGGKCADQLRRSGVIEDIIDHLARMQHNQHEATQRPERACRFCVASQAAEDPKRSAGVTIRRLSPIKKG